MGVGNAVWDARTRARTVPASSQLRLASVLPVRQQRVPPCQQRGLEERLESLPINGLFAGSMFWFLAWWWCGGAGNLFLALASQNLGKY